MAQPASTLDPEVVRLINQALEVLSTKNIKRDHCPRCDTFDWSVDAVAINVAPLRGIPASVPAAYFPAIVPALQIVCKNCGYTMFHNLNTLGLAASPRR